MKEVEGRIEADMDPYKTASRMDTDEIVALHELRDYLEVLVEMCYQGIGYRRVKNPRIWSMHDVATLTEPGGVRSVAERTLIARVREDEAEHPDVDCDLACGRPGGPGTRVPGSSSTATIAC